MEMISRLWPHISSSRRKQLLILFPLMLLSSLSEVVSIGAVVPFIAVLTSPDTLYESEFLQPIIKTLGFADPQELLFPVTLFFILAAITAGALRLFLLWVQTRLSHGIGADLGLSIYEKTLYQSYELHLTRNTSEIISGVGKGNQVIGALISPIFNLASAAFLLIMIVTTLIVINPSVAIFSFLGLGGIYGVIIFLTRSRLSKNGKLLSVLATSRIKALQEGLGGIREVLLDGTQQMYCRIFRETEIPMRRAQASNQFMATSPRFFVEAVGMSFIAGIAYLLVLNKGVVGSSLLPVLGALAMGAQRLLPALQQGYASISSLRSGNAAVRDAMDLLEQSLPDYLCDPDSVTFLPFSNGITIVDLSFRYGDELPWVIRNINLHIAKGSRVGIFGKTGCGKSTLLDILMGLLRASEGEFRVDNAIIDEKNRRQWQSQIAHVPQSIFLSDASVIENIAFGISKEAIDIERVKNAAKKALIDETIEQWDDGYETIVGERGIRLSGGQRQRIGLARALYKNSTLIVLDEATSALDMSTERDVMHSISKIGKDVTVLIVAHRLSTLEKCDVILELSEGRVGRTGNYYELFSDTE